MNLKDYQILRIKDINKIIKCLKENFDKYDIEIKDYAIFETFLERLKIEQENINNEINENENK